MSLSFAERVRIKLAMLLWPAVFKQPQLPLLPFEASYVGDGLATAHGSDFLGDDLFQRSYKVGKATGSWWQCDVEWRAYVLCWAAMRGKSLDGDFVECGVHRGGFSRMILEYVGLERLPEKKLYMIDTFAGLPEPYKATPSAQLVAGKYDDCYEEVVATFAPYPNAVVIRGIVPDVLPRTDIERVCFLSIDLNCVEPTVAAAEYFWPRMTIGAAVVLDDYNFKAFADQKEALDAFAQRKGVEILSLPTGQGLLIKT